MGPAARSISRRAPSLSAARDTSSESRTSFSACASSASSSASVYLVSSCVQIKRCTLKAAVLNFYAATQRHVISSVWATILIHIMHLCNFIYFKPNPIIMNVIRLCTRGSDFSNLDSSRNLFLSDKACAYFFLFKMYPPHPLFLTCFTDGARIDLWRNWRSLASDGAPETLQTESATARRARAHWIRVEGIFKKK